MKSKTFITEYFEDVDSLINAIKEYKRVSNIPNHESSYLFSLQIINISISGAVIIFITSILCW